MTARTVPLERIRNLGILAHVDAGKTTCTERVLFCAGLIHRSGEVHHGNTTTDHLPEEIRHKITISAAAVSVDWTPRTGTMAHACHRLQLIDTPGHVDFTIEVERSLRVLDGAVCLLDASRGVEPQTTTVWHQAERHGVPRIVFVNKMDAAGADFAMCLRALRERLGANAFAVQLPLGEGATFAGVIDLVHRRAYTFPDARDPRVFVAIDVPLAMVDAVETARATLVEGVAAVDDEVLARFVDDGAHAVAGELLERALRRATVTGKVVPVLCGSAFQNNGIPMLLDAIVTLLPSPLDRPAVTGTSPSDGCAVVRAPRDGEPFAALAFKIVSDPFAGTLTFVRVYAGTLDAGSTVLNATRGVRERIGRIVRMQAAEREDVTVVRTGDIVAVVGLKNTRTGDTVCDPDAPVVLGALTVPEPVLEAVIEPRTRGDLDRLGYALAREALEDPSFHVGTDVETGATVLRGMGELHLAIVLERLERAHGVCAVLGPPRVAYRETLAAEGDAHVRHRKQSGGPGQFAEVTIHVAPGERGSGFAFVDATRGGEIPREFVPAVAKGVRDAMSRGVRSGYPLVDVCVRLTGGSAHPNDSSAQAFEIAGSLALQQAARAAGVRLLEPVMSVEVTTPEESLGTVLGDLASRRGRIVDTSVRGTLRVVHAVVPLAALAGYIVALRSLTRGRASATMTPSHHEFVPLSLEPGVLASLAR